MFEDELVEAGGSGVPWREPAVALLGGREGNYTNKNSSSIPHCSQRTTGVSSTNAHVGGLQAAPGRAQVVVLDGPGCPGGDALRLRHHLQAHLATERLEG